MLFRISYELIKNYTLSKVRSALFVIYIMEMNLRILLNVSQRKLEKNTTSLLLAKKEFF